MRGELAPIGLDWTLAGETSSLSFACTKASSSELRRGNSAMISAVLIRWDYSMEASALVAVLCGPAPSTSRELNWFIRHTQGRPLDEAPFDEAQGGHGGRF